jgi:alkylation response protein AidB-like acyl-CoA dehydrogenase
METPSTLELIRTEVRQWIAANWDPTLTLRSWWKLLGESGWAFPHFPTNRFGRGLAPEARKVVREELVAAGAFGPPHGIATMMVAPVLVDLGTDEQCERWLGPIVRGDDVWCQLFSEPEAGSDLASLRTRATLDGESWIVNGQKVWTSGGHYAKWGILVARTDPSVPKHRGLTFFMIDMRQAGVEVRPLVQITGEAHFNEVFLTDAEVPDSFRIAEVGVGWSVAMRVLGYERGSLDSDAEPGIQGEMLLDEPAGRYASGELTDGSESYMPAGAEAWNLLVEILREQGLEQHPVVRDEAIRLYSRLKIATLYGKRLAARADVGAEVSLGKIEATSIMRDWRDLALRCLGAHGTLLDGPGTYGGRIAKIALMVPGLSIAGGTDEIQRNIIGERVLGLPREPQVDKPTGGG